MTHSKPQMYLPKTDGVWQTFCEIYTRKHRPCDGRVTFNADGEIMVGYVVYGHRNAPPKYYCSEPCIVSAFRSR
jgi:hypothetical protein